MMAGVDRSDTVRLYAPGSPHDGREMTLFDAASGRLRLPVQPKLSLTEPEPDLYPTLDVLEFEPSGYRAEDGVAVWHQVGGPRFRPTR